MASPHIRYGGDGDPDWGLSCGELILTSLQRLQNVTQPAQVDARLGTTMSFRELLLQTVHVTEGWRLMGLVPGDVVALVSRNRHEMFPAVLGAVCAGLSVACTVPSSTTAELRHALSLSQPKVVVSESAWLTRTLEAAPAGVRHVALMEEPPEGVTSYLELLRSGEAVEPPLDPDTYRAVDVGDRTESSPFILFSSGTTGLPKGVRLRDSALTLFLENPIGTQRKRPPVDDGGSVSGVAVLTSAPLCWISSVLQSLYAIVYGITRVFLVDPDNVTTMATIDKYKPRSWVVAPTTIASFASLYEHRYRHRYSLSSLHSLSVGGSTVSSEVQAMLQDQLGCRIVQVYGSTEAGVVFNADGQEPLGSIGKLVNVDSGEDIPASTRNVVGEARVRSPYLMHSFVNNPDETAKALDELGFYKTGDLMYEDDNGYFFFVDRIKEMIKYKNNQIAPAEIEMVLLQHPGVNEVCVLGRVSTVDIGDLPTAFVSRAANDAGAALTEAQLQDMVASTLSEYKQLRGGIVFMDRLPKTVTGKIARQKLKEVLKTIS